MALKINKFNHLLFFFFGFRLFRRESKHRIMRRMVQNHKLFLSMSGFNYLISIDNIVVPRKFKILNPGPEIL